MRKLVAAIVLTLSLLVAPLVPIVGSLSPKPQVAAAATSSCTPWYSNWCLYISLCGPIYWNPYIPGWIDHCGRLYG
jgi:hypothetical protein